ncbi:glycosyltransferase family 4 protein [Aminivibrio sp.]|uniref:MraY family glycosyltransferase n=1 Tax=Aminivibrio sp. TaxID=1872489 RepID=UPI001A5CB184|nr:glycosyltransferase family 4 protein [Aminivibrio sp.]MBL3538081.1 glycosyltransferase family 4 protein [Aminivibrio sp.]
MTLLSLVFFSGLALLSCIGTKLYINYARQKAILDIPNERSSHTLPTPRGGGVVFVALFLAVILLCPFFFPREASLWLALSGGGLAVAAIGWIDDRNPLPAWQRLGVHSMAVLWALYHLGGMPSLSMGFASLPLGYIGHVLAFIGGVWMINLYNFMDGIDGLAAGEAALVALAGAFLTTGTPVSVALFALAASVLGFLIWNWSPAKVFMGDAGSGFLGFAFFCFALSTENTNTLPLLTWAVLVSVFAVDATLTLVMRARRRKRLSEAHRDHLYQQFIKAGYPHAAVTGAIFLVTLLLSAAVWRFRPFPLLLFAGVYVALIMTWKLLYGKISAKLRSMEVTK